MKMMDKEYQQVLEYTKSIGYKGVAEMIERLGKSLDPKSNLSSGIQKSMGAGYSKDFAKMKKLIDQIADIWNDIDMDISNQSDNKY
jgi:hypothetical protein